MSRTAYLEQQLRNMITGARWPHGRLPTVRSLSQTYGASSATLVKVLKTIAEDGQIEHAGGRRGYYVAGSAPTSGSAPGASAPHSTEIADQIRSSIVKGDLARDRVLPTLKVLQREYGCHYSTIKAALSELCRIGLIERKGRGYVCTTRRPRSASRSRVYFVGHPGLMGAYQDHVNSCVDTMERTLEQSNWGRLSFCLTEEPPRDRRRFDPENAAGIIYFLFIEQKHWLDKFRSQPALPVVVIDPPGILEQVRLGPRQRYLRIVPDHRRAGRDVALELETRGHKRIAYLSSVRAVDRWAKERLQGVADVYNDSRDLSLTVVERMQDASAKTAGESDVARGLRLMWQGLQSLGDAVPREAIEEGMADAYSLASTAGAALAMRSEFARLLRTGDCTAWICANDSLAVLAWHFLRTNGVKVPEEISVVGFDNSPLTARLGIATYDFRYDQMGTMAVQWLQHPNSVTRKTADTIAFTGTVVMRDSS